MAEPLIEIVPVNVTKYWQNYTPFEDAGNAADFMIGRSWSDWKLFVNGHLYNWPKNNSTIMLWELEIHIKDCIEMDVAFYG